MKLFASKHKKESVTADVTATKEKLRLPLISWIMYGSAAVCLPLYIAFLCSECFSDFFNRYVSSVFRAALAHLTGWIPFSLAELALLLLPVIVFVITMAVLRYYGESLKEMISSIICVFSAAAFMFSSFTLGFAPAYRGSSLDKKLGIERSEVSVEELYSTAQILAKKVAEESENISYGLDGFSIMPYGYEEMNDKLIEAYGKTCDDYSFVQRLDSKLKPVMLSEAMSYTHITGVYTFFTGEANINVAFPDYTLPYTAAHELSHQRGVAREDEANFMAFLVCIRSEDAYIRYSAYLNLYEYVAGQLAGVDPTRYTATYLLLPMSVRSEMSAYAKFYEKYRDSAASDVSETVNDTFLKLHGTEGTRSYGMVVDLAVAYYRDQD